MKTESSLGTRSPVSSGKSVLEQLSASRTPAKAGRDAASSLSFRTLMADIRPGGFEEMTKRMAERRAEHQRLEKERQRERPRAEDMHGNAQVMQRPAAEPQRSRQTDEMHQAERVTKASRQAERVTTASNRDADNASARGASAMEARPAPARAEEARPADESATQAATRAAASESRSTATPGDAVYADSTATASTANQTSAASDSSATGSASAQAATAVDSQASTSSSKMEGLAAADVPKKSSSASSSDDALADQVRQGAQIQLEASPVSETELQQLARQMGLDEPATTDGSVPTTAQGTSDDAVAAAVTKDVTAVDTDENPSAGGEGTATVPPTLATALSRRAQGSSVSAAQPAQDGRVAAAGRPSTSPALPLTSPAADTTSSSRPTTTDASPTPLPTAAVATGRAEGGSFSLGMALPTSGAHSPVRTDGGPLLSSRIDSPINSAEFKEQFARQVAGVVVQGQDRAEIRLTPAELGPIRIRVSLNAEDAALDISAAHAATRAAIESSMSTLKQMLVDHGLRLSDYRMDQGNNAAFLSQQRQSGQENGAGMQQSGTAFGQNGGQSGGQQADGGHGAGRTDRTMGSRPTAVSGGTSGGARVGNTPSNVRLDLFA